MTRVAALAVLGLSEQASPREITQAYRRLAKRTHPDRTGHPDHVAPTHAGAADATHVFAAVADAYRALAAAPGTPPSDGPPSGAVSTPLRPTPVRIRVRRPPDDPPIIAGPVRITPSPSQPPHPGGST